MTRLRPIAAVAALALMIGVVATIEGTASIVDPPRDSDLLAFFLPAATHVADGRVFDIYSVRAFGSYPNYNPPLAVEAMGPLVAIARAVDLPGVRSCIGAGFATLDCRPLVSFVGFAFLPFVLLLAPLALAAIGAARRRLSPGAALLAAGLLMLCPLLWQDFTDWWHLEQPLMLCFLVAGVWQLQSGRVALSGVLIGLALLTRTTAAMPVLALLALLVAERRWRPAATLALIAGAVVAIGIGPFFVADRTDAVYSLLTWRGTAPIGNSIWSLVASTPLGSIARSADQPVAAILALAAGYLAGRRLGVSGQGPALWGVLAVAALIVPLLSKTTWPYYYAEPFVLLLIWESAALGSMRTSAAADADPAAAPDTGAGQDPTLRRWWEGPIPVLSLLFLAAAVTLGQFIGLHSVTNGGIVLRLMGIVQFVTVGAFAIAVWRRLGGATAGAVGRPAPSLS
jgi:hypothetical protein